MLRWTKAGVVVAVLTLLAAAVAAGFAYCAWREAQKQSGLTLQALGEAKTQSGLTQQALGEAKTQSKLTEKALGEAERQSGLTEKALKEAQAQSRMTREAMNLKRATEPARFRFVKLDKVDWFDKPKFPEPLYVEVTLRNVGLLPATNVRLTECPVVEGALRANVKCPGGPPRDNPLVGHDIDTVGPGEEFRFSIGRHLTDFEADPELSKVLGRLETAQTNVLMYAKVTFDDGFEKGQMFIFCKFVLDERLVWDNCNRER